jgi:anaerobic magnesium-protoporphyrin IX monomethyl ester cyclase
LKVLLVNPPRFEGIPVIREERCEITERYSVLPPYSLLQIASILRNNGHKVELIDANGLNLAWDQLNAQMNIIDYEVLIFRFTPTTFDEDNKAASVSKQSHPKAWTIGICCTLYTVPKEVLQGSPDLDIYIGHEYEVVAPAVVDALSGGADLSSVEGIAYRKGSNLRVTEDVESLADWDSMPLPAYDLLGSLRPYFINTPHGSPFTTMYTSKGCPYSCIFCTVRNTPVRKRSAESVLEELRYLKKKFNIKMVSFFDETFTLDRPRVIAICDALKKEKLKVIWYCNTRVNLVDSALLKLMYEAGCRGLSFGIESGSQEILDRARKGTTVKQAENAVKWAKEAGIKVLCSFIIGLPGENLRTAEETINFVKRTLPTGAQFNVAVPYPGSDLYRIAINKGWIKKDIDWRQMFQHESIMRTDRLDNESLNRARKKAYRALYFNPKWWLQNTGHTLRHLEDLPLATRYSFKIMINFILRKMEHGH